MIEVYLTNLGLYNEGKLVGKWLKLPTTDDEISKTLEEILIDDCMYEEYFITDYETNVKGLYGKLGEYENISELNYLVERLSELDDYELETFEALLELEGSEDIVFLINLTYNLDNCNYISGVKDCDDLGQYYADEYDMLLISDTLKRYFDYESYGRDIQINNGGIFTEKGYIENLNGSYVQYYKGMNDVS